MVTGCNYDVLESRNINKLSVLHFESYEQMQDELSSVIKMSIEAKSKWAEQKGFSSFGVNAEKFYNTLDINQFKKKEDIVNFIENSKYLELITEPSGNQMVQTKECNNKYRYFINDEKIFTVEDKVVKIFGDITLITCLDNLEEIKQLQSPETVLDNPDYYILYNKNDALKSTYPGCGIDLEASPENNSDGRTYRVIMHIWVEDNFNLFTNEDRVETHYKLISQRTFLGIFFNYENTITYSLNLKSHFINGLHYSQSQYFNLSGSKKCTILEDSKVEITANYNYNSQIHFDNFNCSASVPQTSSNPATLSCN